MRKFLSALVVASSLACGAANAAIDTYVAFLFGANEVPAGAGDPDGFGAAALAIDNVANSATWAILANNIVFPLTGAHIHQAPAGVNGPVIVDFGGQLTGSVTDVDLALITPATASGFYVNLHNAVYPGGAIRGQLQFTGSTAPPIPEPETYALMLAGLAAVAWAVRRRRA